MEDDQMAAVKYYRVIFDWSKKVVIDEYGDATFIETPGQLLMLEFTVIKTTPRGVWIYDDKYRREKRFIITDSNRSFAKSTKAKALESYRLRNNRRRALLANSLKECEAGHSAALSCKDPESIKVRWR